MNNLLAGIVGIGSFMLTAFSLIWGVLGFSFLPFAIIGLIGMGIGYFGCDTHS